MQPVAQRDLARSLARPAPGSPRRSPPSPHRSSGAVAASPSGLRRDGNCAHQLANYLAHEPRCRDQRDSINPSPSSGARWGSGSAYGPTRGSYGDKRGGSRAAPSADTPGRRRPNYGSLPRRGGEVRGRVLRSPQRSARWRGKNLRSGHLDLEFRRFPRDERNYVRAESSSDVTTMGNRRVSTARIMAWRELWRGANYGGGANYGVARIMAWRELLRGRYNRRLAEALGVPCSTAKSWLSGRRRMPVTHLCALAHVLRHDIDVINSALSHLEIEIARREREPRVRGFFEVDGIRPVSGRTEADRTGSGYAGTGGLVPTGGGSGP